MCFPIFIYLFSSMHVNHGIARKFLSFKNFICKQSMFMCRYLYIYNKKKKRFSYIWRDVVCSTKRQQPYRIVYKMSNSIEKNESVFVYI